jgi:phospho-N-acetylmuramoyl-pentapeptide-transferase
VLLYLTNYLAQFESGFNVFNYLTMRAILGALTALILSFVIGPRMIAKLSMNQVGQPVREEGPVTHLPKAGTPTMGGALILTAIAISTLLWGDLENLFVWIVLFVMLSFGVIGYVDDYKKLVLQDPAGISAKQKLFWQSAAALIAAIALYVTATDEVSTSLLIPYFKDLSIPLGMFQVVVTYRQSYGWPRRPRDHADRPGGGCPRSVRLRHRQHQFLGLPRHPVCRRHWRSAGFLCGARGCRTGVPLVQHLSRAGVHG